MIIRDRTATLPTKVFTQRNFVADFIRLKLNFIKNEKIAFWATFWGLMDIVRTPSIARWKAHGRLPTRYNWTYFAISYGLNILSGNLSKSAFFEGEWVTLGTNFRRKRHRPPTTVGVRKPEWLPFRVVSKYPQCIVWFCHKAHMSETDGQTDRQTELRLPTVPRPR